MSVVLSTKELRRKRADIMASICKAVNPENIFIEENLALIAIVGRGMVKAKGTAAKIGFSLNTTPALQKYFAQYEKQISAAEIREKSEAEAKERAAREKAESEAKQGQTNSSKKTSAPTRSSDKKQQLPAEKNLSASKK